MADILADLTLFSRKSAKSKKDKIKVVTDFLSSQEYLKDEFPVSVLHAKLLVLGDVKILLDMEKGAYAN